ncbi:MAG TPA: phosphotransferase family protein, partial [Acidimicrobiales bacterium]|nr:phosphotransferase family protein [Acidimicrobiales bacterium]
MSDRWSRGVDLEALSGWMDDQGLPAGALEDVERLGGGTQNVLLRFRRGGEVYVFRGPPPHKRGNSDETMRREARVLAALRGTDVPHPELIAACPDEAVIGAAFYLMTPIDGVNPTVGLPDPYVADRGWRWQLGLAMADGAASVGAVDHVAAGLSDLGRAEGYLERQVARWRAQLDSYSSLPGYPGPDIPHVEEVGEWLDANRPPAYAPGLIHGDYHLANVLVATDRPGLAAIVDWELTTIGDPLLDLGWLLATWPDPDEPMAGSVGVQPWDGFPAAEDLVDRYSERTTRDLGAVHWYEVLACYKLGLILEGTHARAFAGQAPKEIGDRLHASTVGLF